MATHLAISREAGGVSGEGGAIRYTLHAVRREGIIDYSLLIIGSPPAPAELRVCKKGSHIEETGSGGATCL